MQGWKLGAFSRPKRPSDSSPRSPTGSERSSIRGVCRVCACVLARARLKGAFPWARRARSRAFYNQKGVSCCACVPACVRACVCVCVAVSGLELRESHEHVWKVQTRAKRGTLEGLCAAPPCNTKGWQGRRVARVAGLQNVVTPAGSRVA